MANTPKVAKKMMSFRVDEALHRKYKKRAVDLAVPLARLLEETLLGATSSWPKGSR